MIIIIIIKLLCIAPRDHFGLCGCNFIIINYREIRESVFTIIKIKTGMKKCVGRKYWLEMSYMRKSEIIAYAMILFFYSNDKKNYK